MIFRCLVCGYLHDGNEPPAQCPKCGSDSSHFTEVPQDEADKIIRSRFTNDLHLQLSATLDNVIMITEEGISDDLDPGCVDVFSKTRNWALESKKMITAELAGHMKKGKWN